MITLIRVAGGGDVMASRLLRCTVMNTVTPASMIVSNTTPRQPRSGDVLIGERAVEHRVVERTIYVVHDLDEGGGDETLVVVPETVEVLDRAAERARVDTIALHEVRTFVRDDWSGTGMSARALLELIGELGVDVATFIGGYRASGVPLGTYIRQQRVRSADAEVDHDADAPAPTRCSWTVYDAYGRVLSSTALRSSGAHPTRVPPMMIQGGKLITARTRRARSTRARGSSGLQ